MEKYINAAGKPCFKGVTESSEFNPELFYAPDWQGGEDSACFALHTNIGSITVVDRMTGFGFRDIESGYRDVDGNFWLASGNYDVRDSGCKTVGEAIQWIKQRANGCDPDEAR